MVKGISRQVIVVQSPEPELFDQAIFILKDNMGEGITDDALLKEAKRVIQGSHSPRKNRQTWLWAGMYASFGALLTGAVWLLTAVFSLA